MASASKLAHLPVGSGLRSSFSGRVVTVFGCTGRVGKIIVGRLGREGNQIIAATRGDDYYARDLKVCGDLGQVLIRPYHLKDEESIRKCVQYSDIVINATGRQHNRFLAKQGMTEVNVEGAQRLARISKEAGVDRFVHLSAVGATADHKSEFMRTKAASEVAVRSEFPDATIVRTAQPIHMYSRLVDYINFAYRWFLSFKLVPIGLAHTVIKQPVAYEDFARGVLAVATRSEAVGQTYELLGPEKLTMAEMYDMIYTSKFQNHRLLPVPASLLMLYPLPHELISLRAPKISRDEIIRFFSPDTPSTPALPGFAELGITPKSAEFVFIDAMRQYRNNMYARMSFEDVKEQRSM